MNIYEKIASLKIVPVIVIDNVDAALHLADALIEGGLSIAEITFRTEAAAKVISTLAKERPQLTVGAGTIMTLDNLKKAVDCGAQFGVAPGFNPKIAAEAIKMKFPFSPGVMTPSEIECSLDLGIKYLKFFPAEAAGGVKMLKSLIPPFAHTGVKFIPLGGVSALNMKEYLAIPQVVAVGGTWIALKDDISSSNWAKIKANCVSALKILAA